MKRFLTFLMVAVLALSCVSFASAEDKTTVRVLWWGSQARHDLTVKAIEKFEEKYPDIDIEYEFTDWNGYWSKLATQVAGNLMPDVIQMDYAYLVQYADTGVLADLTPYIESGALDVSNVSESVLSSGMVGDRNFAIATGTNAMVMFYRPDVLEQAGVEMPIEPTMSEFNDIQKKVFEATGRTSGCTPISITDGLRFLLRSYGMNLYNEEGTALGFDDPKYIVEMWKFWIDQRDAGVILDVGEATAATAFDGMVSDTWNSFHWTNELAAYQEGSSCELNLAVYPSMEDATQAPTYFKPTMFWSLSEKSTVKDAAVTFINYFTNDTDCFDIVRDDRGMPISSVIREHLSSSFDETAAKVAAMMDYLGQEGKTSPIMKADVAVHNELESLHGQYWEQVQYGLVDDLTAHAQAFMDECNQIIAADLASKAEAAE